MTQETTDIISFLKIDVLPEIKKVQQSLDDLVGVPDSIDEVHQTTKAIMADLVITRKEHVDATTRLTDALIKLANRVAVGFFIVVLFCLAGFFGRNLILESGNNSAAFTNQQQVKTE